MAVNNSIKVGPLVFLLWMFVITENIMKRPVCKAETRTRVKTDGAKYKKKKNRSTRTADVRGGKRMNKLQTIYF